MQKKNYENHSGLYVHKAQIATDDVTKYNQLNGSLVIEDIEWQMSGDLGAKFRVMSRHSPTFSFSMHTSKCEATSRWIWSSTWHIFCHSGFSPHSECELCWSTCLLFQPLQISAEACQGLELEHWQVQHNPEEVSRIMQVKDASNVTLHVLDILLMPSDETVRTYSHLLLTHWSRPTARLQHKVLHPREFTLYWFILLPFTHLPCTVPLVASAPGCVFHLKTKATWQNWQSRLVK